MKASLKITLAYTVFFLVAPIENLCKSFKSAWEHFRFTQNMKNSWYKLERIIERRE